MTFYLLGVSSDHEYQIRETAAVNQSSSRPYIAIEGVIGVGKTTLARLLQPRFRAELLMEAFDENPFLSDFYDDRARYAFQTQIFFLLSRYRQQQRVPPLIQQSALMADYFFAKDRLFAHLNLQGDELEMYDRLYEALAEKVHPPDLVVYLRAETDTLMARIAMRDRPYERQMDRAYIEALRQGYEELFANYVTTPLLVIETDEMDFVRNPADFDTIESQIRAALAGIHQPKLPELAAPPAPRLAWTLPTLPVAEPRSTANWQALGDFLALVEAVGQIGAALSQQPPIGPDGAPASLQEALNGAMTTLEALAVRVSLPLAGLHSE